MADPPGGDRTVIVTDANHSISIPFIRSLARAGWRVVAASHDRSGVGLRSRHVSARVLHPSPGRDPEAFVESVASAIVRHDAALVVPLSEATLVAIMEHRARLPAACSIAMPEPDAFEVALDKRRTVALAEDLAVPVPRTGIAASVEEAVERARLMRAPYVLKPSSTRRRIAGRSRLGTLYAADLTAVAAQAARLLPDPDGMLVQEYVPGHGVGVNMLMRDGRPLLAFQHRRLREVPVWGGASALRESAVVADRLFRDAAALLGALRWTGLAMVEFRVMDGEYRLMEVNGRAWGSMALAVAAGVDFPAAAAELHVSGGEPPEAGQWSSAPLATTPYEIGVRSRNLQLDVLWMLSVVARRPRQAVRPWPPRRDALRAMLQLLDPRIRYDVVSRDDPRPGAQELLHLTRHVLTHLVRR